MLCFPSSCVVFERGEEKIIVAALRRKAAIQLLDQVNVLVNAVKIHIARPQRAGLAKITQEQLRGASHGRTRFGSPFWP